MHGRQPPLSFFFLKKNSRLLPTIFQDASAEFCFTKIFASSLVILTENYTRLLPIAGKSYTSAMGFYFILFLLSVIRGIFFYGEFILNTT